MNALNKSGYPIIISSSLLFVFWILFAVFLPMQEEYIHWVMDSDWVWVNSVGFLGSLLGIFAINSFFSNGQNSKTEGILYICSIAGIVIMTAILFFEAFILKGIAIQQADIVVLNEGFYLFAPFRLVSLLGGILLSVGIIGICIKYIKLRQLKSWKLITLAIGTPLFSLIIVPGNLRLLGVLLYFIGFLFIGIEIQKKN
jgi:hypothetical protein